LRLYYLLLLLLLLLLLAIFPLFSLNFSLMFPF